MTSTGAKPRSKKLLFTSLKLLIAVVGIYLVVRSLHWDDRVRLLDPAGRTLLEAHVVGDPPEDHWPLTLRLPNGTTRQLDQRDALALADVATVVRAADRATLTVRAFNPTSRTLYVAEPTAPARSAPLLPLPAADASPPYEVRFAFPQREIGIRRMLATAQLSWLLLAILVIPAIYLITGYRWYLLLQGLNVALPLRTALQINLVGAFYNTFMPGQTGGDILKAWYAARNAREHRTRAVLSVIVDRAIGLLALVIMGGACASLQWQIPECRQVAVGALVIVSAIVGGVVVLGVRGIRRAVGLDYLLGKLPLRGKVDKVTEALRLYRARPGLVGAALLMSFPVHAVIVVSAIFAGWAFGLPLDWKYYWVVVPTVVLAGAMPISPQGAGVMEFFAILLTKPQGATIGQAFALTLSIRLVQIVWNLASGLVVLGGKYHVPTDQEAAELEQPDDAPQQPVAPN